MKTHNLTQGSTEWLQYRSTHFNASDAAAMLGMSPYKTRSQLMHELHTGLTPDVDPRTQARFDAGHAAEAAARPLAEAEIGEDLFPVVGSLEVGGLPLSASFDGLTMMENIVWEHKLMNVNLADSLSMCIIPDQYLPQLEQQLLVSGADKALFMATSADKTAMECVWYTSNPAMRQRLIDGWKQFAADLSTYTPDEVVVTPVANAVAALPAVSVQVSGAIAIRDNMPAFEVALRDFIDHRLITDPKTDQDFADLDLQIKALKNAEVALDAAEAQMLAQVESVDAAKRMKDMLHKLTRDNRLAAEKLLAARKETIRAEAVLDGRNALQDHIAALTMRIGKPLMPAIAYDFAGGIKGKRSIDSMRDAIAVELARAKIEANTVADRITANLRTLNEKPELAFLFADIASLVLKAPDDLVAVVQNRIAFHQACEADRAERERARIAAEERAKAEAAERIRADAEIAAATAKARAQAHAQAQADAAARRASDGAIAKAQTVSVRLVESSMFLHEPNQPTAPAVIAQTATEVAPYQVDVILGQPTLKLGHIADRLGFSLTADFLRHLGFEPAATDKAERLYHEQDFPRMCAVLVRHIQQVAQGVAA